MFEGPWIIFSVHKVFKNISQGTYNKRICIEAVELHRVIEPEHSNCMTTYIMLSISLRKDAKNEFEKDFFKLMNNRVFGKTMENIRRMPWSRNFQMVILKNVDGIWYQIIGFLTICYENHRIRKWMCQKWPKILRKFFQRTYNKHD